MLIAVLCSAPGLQGEEYDSSSGKNAYGRAYDIASPSVVSIRGEKKFDAKEAGKSPIAGKMPGKSENVTGMGTGIIVDHRGYIVTNYHVVKGLTKIQVTTSDETLFREVEFISYDQKTDLALLKVRPIKPLTPIRFGRSDRVYVCQDVLAIGNPFGYSNAVSRGIVSGLDRPLTSSETASYDSVIQTDTAINPGNSGGPLVNLDGEMIGMNAAVRDDAQNIAFAIPVDMVADVVERMIRVSAAKMTSHHGLTLEAVETPSGGHPRGTYETDSVRVLAVEPNSPADAAGIEPGDFLLTSNEIEIKTPFDFTRSLIGVGLADPVDITYKRENTKQTARMALSISTPNADGGELLAVAKRPVGEKNSGGFHEASAAPSYTRDVAFGGSKERSAMGETVLHALGVEVEPVSAEEYKKRYPDLSVVSMDNYKIIPSGGVTVTAVSESTPFKTEKSGIQKGDLIFGFVVDDSPENRWGVSSLDNLYFIARKWNELAGTAGNAKVYLIRGGAPYFLDIPMKAIEE